MSKFDTLCESILEKKGYDKEILVYRVEDKDGEGPYSQRPNLSQELQDILNSHSKGKPFEIRPGVRDEKFKDGGLWLRQHNSAFPTITDLKRWFTPKARKLLKKDGFMVSIYVLPFRLWDKYLRNYVETDLEFYTPASFPQHKALPKRRIKQASFIKKDAELLTQMELTEI